MLCRNQVREVSSSSLHLCCRSLCAAPPPLTRREAAWHSLWVAVPHQLISSLLSFLIFPAYPWSLCLPGCLIFWPLIFPPAPAPLSVSPSLRRAERDDRVWKKKRERRILYAVTMATASRSRASPPPQTCVLPLSLSPLLAWLRLKRSSDENEEKEKEAGGTRDKAALVREE